MIRYVIDKYGKDRVAQIVTFGTMAARAAVRDAGRALGVPLPDVDRVAKLIPSGPGGLTIPQALKQIPELRARNLDDMVLERVVIEYLSRARFCHELQIVNGLKPGQLSRALAGEKVGTIIEKEKRS